MNVLNLIIFPTNHHKITYHQAMIYFDTYIVVTLRDGNTVPNQTFFRKNIWV